MTGGDSIDHIDNFFSLGQDEQTIHCSFVHCSVKMGVHLESRLDRANVCATRVSGVMHV